MPEIIRPRNIKIWVNIDSDSVAKLLIKLLFFEYFKITHGRYEIAIW